jgi:putative transposase
MRRGRFTEDQIIGVLRGHEAGVKTAELCRKHGISDTTFYNWKAKYGGVTVSEAARLRAFEDENRRLKKLLAESMLDVLALKHLLGKKLTQSGDRYAAVKKLMADRVGSVCLHRLAALISGSPLVDHAAAEAAGRSISGLACDRQARNAV